jgi:nitroimidazol reductase NimA-like FMN-containing flavoprotein (pyridoxamine 5'-phosphate oxidase superfamily)
VLGELDHNEIESILHHQVVGRIGCKDGDKVFVVPITYVYDNNFIYCHSRVGQKIQMMRRDPFVCFEVDEVTSLTSWKSVIVWGTYEELTDEEARQTGIKIFSERMKPFVTSETVGPMMRQPEPHPPDVGPKPVFFRIKLTKKTGRFERG